MQNPFEIDEPSTDRQSILYSIELNHKLMIALALLLYHVGLITFEYGANRKKNAEMPLFRYPCILILSVMFTYIIGFGVAHGDSHMLGVKYYFLQGVFDYRMAIVDHPIDIVP